MLRVLVRIWAIAFLLLFALLDFNASALAQNFEDPYNSEVARQLRAREQKLVDSIDRTQDQYWSDHEYINSLIRDNWKKRKDGYQSMEDRYIVALGKTAIDLIGPKKAKLAVKGLLNPNGALAEVEELYDNWDDFADAMMEYETLNADYRELKKIIEQKYSRYRAQMTALQIELRRLEVDKQKARNAGLIPPGGRYDPITDNFTITSPDRRGLKTWEFYYANLELTSMEFEFLSDEPEIVLELATVDANEVAKSLLKKDS